MKIAISEKKDNYFLFLIDILTLYYMLYTIEKFML